MYKFESVIKSLNKIASPNKYKKIFILTGKKSFFLSGAKKIIDKFLSNREYSFYFKKSKIPQVDELKRIIIKINKFEPDLVLAIGGGAVLDYAKIANSFDNIQNLNSRIIRSTYKVKKNGFN